MSKPYLTVEDVNSVLFHIDRVNEYYCIDTSLISIFPSDYDFCKVRKTSSGGNYTYTIIVNSNLWTGGFYVTKTNGEYMDVSATYDSANNSFVFTTNQSAVKIYLYLCGFAPAFEFQQLTVKYDFEDKYVINTLSETNVFDLNVESVNGDDLAGAVFSYEHLGTSLPEKQTTCEDDIISLDFEVGCIIKIEYDNTFAYIKVFNKKVEAEISFVESEVVVGKNNIVVLDVPEVLEVGTDSITDVPFLDGRVYYDNTYSDLMFDETNNNYYFNIDLTSDIVRRNIKLDLNIFESEYIKSKSYKYEITSSYLQVNTLNEFVNEIGINGSNIIEFGSDITTNTYDTILIEHDIIIYGNHKTLTNKSPLHIANNVNVKINDLNIRRNGIVQQKDTTLELNNCNFTDVPKMLIIGEYTYYPSSCISIYPVDYAYGIELYDMQTKINKCEFINCDTAIASSGELIITNSKFLKNTGFDKTEPAFIYQLDGSAIIQNSIFDINYDNDYLCEHQQHIGFGQSIILIGETASVNNKTYSQLQKDNSLDFFGSNYNNKSHLFAKYYYPQIEECVYSSPMENYEDNCCCHSLAGLNWNFKNNVKITRVSWETENRNTNINW